MENTDIADQDESRAGMKARRTRGSGKAGAAIIEADRHRDAGDWAAAAAGYKLALDLGPTRKDIWVQYGHALKEAGQPREAESAYSHALMLDGQYDDAKLHLAHLLKNTGAVLPALELFNELAANPAVDVAGEIAHLRTLVDIDDEMELVLFQSISACGNIPDAEGVPVLVDLGDSFREERNWTAAAGAYAAALLKNPILVPIWVQYGHALKESGQVDKAVVAYRKATLIDGRDLDARLHLSHAYKLNDRFEEALESFQILKAGGKHDVDGEIDWLLQQRAGTRKTPHGSGKSADSVRQSVAAADQYRDQRQWEQAAKGYGAILADDPSLRHIWVQYGHALKESGDLTGAESAYRHACTLDADDPDTLLHLGHLLKRMGRFDDALAVFEALVLMPGQSNVVDDIVDLKLEAEENRYFAEDDGNVTAVGGGGRASERRVSAPIAPTPGATESTAGIVAVSVHMADCLIGVAEVDRHAPVEALSKTILGPILRFCQMHGFAPEDTLKLAAQGRALSAPEPSTIAPEASEILCVGRSVAPFGYTVEELAFTTMTDLRVRFGGAGAEGRNCLVVLYQAGGEGRPQILAHRQITGDGPHFVDVRMASPWMPILAAFSDGERLVDVAILPFPSLLRGGAHFGEALSARLIVPAMAAPSQLPLALLKEFLGSAGAPAPFSVGRVLVDLTEANGEEAIFSTECRIWMETLFGLAVVPADGGAAMSAGGRFLAESLADSTQSGPRVTARAAEGTLDMVIPGNGLPTLSAMVSRRLSLAQGQDGATGSFVQADVAGARPRLLVNLPVLDNDIVALQPDGRACVMPILARRYAAAEDGPQAAGGPIGWQAPLAICYADQKDTRDAEFLMRRAPDAKGAVLRSSLPEAWQAPGLLSVVLCQGNEAESAVLSDLLLAQTIAAFIDVVRVERSPAGADATQRIAEVFAGRHTVIHAHGATLADAINRGVAAATGRFVAIVSPSMTLHESRCLEVLCTMAAAERVATAGCVHLHEAQFKRGQQFKPVTGGYFPTHISLMSPPALVFKETRTDGAFPSATYPVAANAFRLVVMRREVFDQLQGLDAVGFPDGRFDLEFSLRALAGGYLNLCTSAVTAVTRDMVDSGEIVDVLSPATLPTERWQDVLTHLAMLREL